MRIRVPVVLGMIALTLLGALGMYWSFNEIAVGAITGIAASLNKLVERDD